MIIEFPLFGAGINYFPYEISVLRIFEPRYLLLIGDCIKDSNTFCVGNSIDTIGEVVSEVKILDHKDISNAEQVVVVECINLMKITNINLDDEYPKANCENVFDVGLPPTEEELLQLQNNIKRSIGKMVEQGLDIDLPTFEIDTSNRILKLWELTSKVPMANEVRKSLIEEKEIIKRYEILNTYIKSINDMSF